MEYLEDPFKAVCALNPIAVKLLMIFIFGKRQGIEINTEADLQIYGDMSQNTVRKGLAQLIFYGYVRERGKGRGWALVGGALQLPLMVTEDEGKSQIFDSSGVYYYYYYNRRRSRCTECSSRRRVKYSFFGHFR